MEDRTTKQLELKHTLPENLSVAADAHEQSAAISRSQDSQPRGCSPKRLSPAVASAKQPAHSGQDVLYGHYHRGPFHCCTHTRQSTYKKTARATEFLYHQLIEDNNMVDWTYIPSSWLLSHTFPADLNVKIISGLARNRYLTFPNILAVAKAHDIQMIRIGSHWKSRSGREVWRQPRAKGPADTNGGPEDESAVEGGGSDSDGSCIASSAAVCQPLPADGLLLARSGGGGGGSVLIGV